MLRGWCRASACRKVGVGLGETWALRTCRSLPIKRRPHRLLQIGASIGLFENTARIERLATRMRGLEVRKSRCQQHLVTLPAREAGKLDPIDTARHHDIGKDKIELLLPGHCVKSF